MFSNVFSLFAQLFFCFCVSFVVCCNVVQTNVHCAEVSKLFTSFHQVGQLQHDQQRYSSSGLGLNIVKSLIQLQHGQCTCESEINKGATFSFTIPLQIGTINMSNEPLYEEIYQQQSKQNNSK
jgi:hypothetical protein